MIELLENPVACEKFNSVSSWVAVSLTPDIDVLDSLRSDSEKLIICFLIVCVKVNPADSSVICRGLTFFCFISPNSFFVCGSPCSPVQCCYAAKHRARIASGERGFCVFTPQNHKKEGGNE